MKLGPGIYFYLRNNSVQQVATFRALPAHQFSFPPLNQVYGRTTVRNLKYLSKERLLTCNQIVNLVMSTLFIAHKSYFKSVIFTNKNMFDHFHQLTSYFKS